MASVLHSGSNGLGLTPGGVLRHVNDRDDRMGANLRTQKNPLVFRHYPKKSLDQK